MRDTLAYIAAHKDRFISELMCFLRIPSVSSDEVYVDSVKEAADFVKGQLEQSGADFAVVEPTKRHPVVYGERFVDASLPTVLVYGHYDVQPVDPIELWQHPPFEPIIQDEKIYARGACDDKGQMFMHLKSLEYMVASQQSFCNLKFVFEGEEEIGSPSFENYLVENRDKLKADVVLVSDTAMIDLNIPSIVYGLKGITYFDIEVIGSSKDLHSGIYGGAISNPLNVLCSMIARLHDDNKVITIPNFYQDIIPPTKEEVFSVHQIPFCLEKYKSDGGIKEVAGEKGFDTLENIAFRPTLDVNGMWGGYTGEGAKTVIPSKAFAKISMRLVPGQSAEAIISSFSDYFKSLAPEGMEVKIEVLASCESALLPIDSIPYKAAEEALRKTFGRDPVPVRMGGSIPVISMFKKTLGINSILMGFGLDSDDIHSPNEHFGIPNFLKGIETIPLFYKYYYESMLHAKVNPEQLDLHSL